MALPIFFLADDASANLLTLNEDTSKHVVQVLRMSTGELLQLTDGKGTLLTAEIVDPHKKACTVNITERLFKEPPKKRVSIAISLLKNTTRFEWFLEKATEIGVREIIVLKCDRTEKQHFRWDRMNNILIAAMLQSQQCWQPLLSEPMLFKDVVATSVYKEKLIAHCDEQYKQTIPELKVPADTQILIGPEGDFTREEIALAVSKGYKPVSLGNTRLRTETAGVVAATLLCL